MRRLPVLVALGGLVLISGPALADEPESLSEPSTDVPAISDGFEAANCQFPTTLSIGTGNCTATLVHPRVITTAAHCPSPATLRMGETAFSPARTLSTEFCVSRPEWAEQQNAVNGWDATVCVLSEPVTDVPITPPVYGCEVPELKPENELIAIVGFGGVNDGGGNGIKRFHQTIVGGDFGAVITWDSQMIFVGQPGKDSCPGDSGGPAYTQLADGVWRTFGITSGGPAGCGTGGGQYVLIPWHLAWMEEVSGVDMTPCHDSDGTWNPTEDCKGFSMDPLSTAGNWASGCQHQTSDYLDFCGPAFGEEHPGPPVVTINEPADQSQYEGASADVPINFAIDHPWPAREARIYINDELLGTDDWPPFQFGGGTFPEGTYDIRIEVEDWSGEVGVAYSNIGVGVAPNENPNGDGDGDGNGDGDGDGDGDAGLTGGTAGAGDDSGDGGGCSVADRNDAGPAGLVLFTMLGLAATRRRRDR